MEARTVGGFLDSAASEPSALLIEGEPGIGKTTLWLAAHELARDRGFRVLSARAAAAESVLAYTALADLLDGVPAAAWAGLPEPQRSAVDQVLLRTDNGSATDQRAVAAVQGTHGRHHADRQSGRVPARGPAAELCWGCEQLRDVSGRDFSGRSGHRRETGPRGRRPRMRAPR